ncbi:peptidylprolyl isomerase [Aquicoccus porphyridii]|uniref:Peptidylprolyl isomerase n=1 Tax=Aquicoccus porphyridii TaxID=1852029 RepID=A0A5A9ZUU9_9RHOB|nr:peptidyl-prolyl cis-trans isomerase [Aquicoccus porphyridii]KAA0920980.1 peptidylprolyl isomerase [Aquicoccus porphyridii]RAI56482.1 peptidylprolyl isomerase [Rhodobacteraceae bacterium AsT-22]
MARGTTSKTLVWILMALLILGLGGFGVTNLSGNIRTIGSVGGQDITVNAYVRALQDEIRAREAETGEPIPFSQARDMGLDQVALARLIASTALDNETVQLGLSVGDANLRDQLLQIQGFQGLDGSFDRDGYRFYLDRTNQSEAEFEEGLRREIARGLLQAAVLSGVTASPTYADTIVSHLAERRNFTWARLSEADLDTPLGEPTEAQLAAFHSENAERFMQPEMKRITYAWLSPDMILDQVEIDEATLRSHYEDREDEFNRPERRLVERLVFADEAAAEAAKITIESGDKSFEDIVAERGLDLSDVDMGDVLPSDLGDAGPAAFNADPGTTIGPFPTDLGPALFRVNAVLPASSMPFEEAAAMIRDDLALGRTRRQIEDQMNPVDDLLAAGASIEELAEETEMRLFTLDWTPSISEGAAGYEAFQEAAAALSQDDFPELIALDDGGIVAMRLDEILPPRQLSLDEVRDDVTAAWEEAELTRRLTEKAEALLPQVTPEADMAALGLTVTQETGITRGAFIPGMPENFLTRVFAMQEGEARIIDLPAGVALVRLDAIQPPDENDEAVPALRDALTEQASSSQAQDLFQYYINDLQARAGLQLDQTAINAVLANFQ